ncbi:hypothetical protein BGZ81_006339 [Podila clonocystis]|nr:hypothetical protein BGZ81_006339 [Podila clonocystis]
MICGYRNSSYDCYDEAGNKLYSGLTLGQLVGVIFGYLALFGLLAKHYRRSSAARKIMAMKMQKMESHLARLESIHVVLEAMPQLLEQRLHGTNSDLCSGLTLGQLIGIAFDYNVLFGLLWTQYCDA